MLVTCVPYQISRGFSTCIESSHVTCSQWLRIWIGITWCYMSLYVLIVIHIDLISVYIDLHGVFLCYFWEHYICNIGTQMSTSGSIHLQHWCPNVNIRIAPFATLVPRYPKCQYSDRSICNIGTQMSIFISIHLQHWYRITATGHYSNNCSTN